MVKKTAKDKIKDKQKKTLERMKQARKDDSIFLRNKIEAKLKEVSAEYDKANAYIINLEDQITKTENMKLKLEGAIVSLKGLLLNEPSV